MATIWLPKIYNDACGSQTIRYGKIKKTIAAQYFLTYSNTIKNSKTTTRNEKVACSSQVTSSKKTPNPFGLGVFLCVT